MITVHLENRRILTGEILRLSKPSGHIVALVDDFMSEDMVVLPRPWGSFRVENNEIILEGIEELNGFSLTVVIMTMRDFMVFNGNAEIVIVARGKRPADAETINFELYALAEGGTFKLA